MAHLQYLPGDPRLVDQLVYELKSKGIFDQFRKDCIADVDTRPAYQNLRQRVESSVTAFLSRQCWQPDLNKNQLREKLRKHILDGNYLEQGVERIVDQVVNPRVASVFIPQVEDLVYNYFGITRKKSSNAEASNGKADDLLPNDLEAVSPGSVKSNDDQNEEMEIDESSSKMEIDEEKSKSEYKEDTVTEKDDTRLSGISELTIHDSNICIDKENIPFPPDDIIVENIPPPENSPPKIVELEKIELPKERSVDIPLPDEMSTDIPLPDEVLEKDKEHYFKPINSEEDDDSSSDSSLRRNMSPLTPIRNFNNENSCDAQQAFENDLTNDKNDEIKEPSSFRFTIEAKSVEASSDAIKIERTDTKLSYQFNNQINMNSFNTPVYEDSSNSNNLQIDYESDVNSKTNTESKPTEIDQNSEDSRKDKKLEEKKSIHKSSHRSRDSHRRSNSKDRRSSSKQSSSKDSSRHDKSKSSKEESKSKTSDKDKTKEKGDKKDNKDSKESSRHKSSHKSSHRDSKSHRSSSSSHRHSSKHSDDKKSSSSSQKDKGKSSKDRSKDSKSSSHRSDKSRKSSSGSSSKSKQDDKEKYKKSKKETDDHYSLSGRGNPNRRSTDRDSNDGSSSSKGSHNPPSSKSSESKKDSKTSSKLDSTTTTSGDSTSPSDKENIAYEIGLKAKELLKAKPVIRIEKNLETPVTSPPRLPFVPDITIKKPKFASNMKEAREMMKMRKFLEEEQRRMNQEAALLLEFQANVRPSLSQVYSSVPGPELEFACLANPVQLEELRNENNMEIVEESPEHAIIKEDSKSADELKPMRKVAVDTENLTTKPDKNISNQVIDKLKERTGKEMEVKATNNIDAIELYLQAIHEEEPDVNNFKYEYLTDTKNENKNVIISTDDFNGKTHKQNNILKICDDLNDNNSNQDGLKQNDVINENKKRTEFYQVTIITEELSESEENIDNLKQDDIESEEDIPDLKEEIISESERNKIHMKEDNNKKTKEDNITELKGKNIMELSQDYVKETKKDNQEIKENVAAKTNKQDDIFEFNYFAEHEKYTAELERARFSNVYKEICDRYLSTNKIYLINCDTYEENIFRDLSEEFGGYDIVNYHRNGHLKLPKPIVKNINLTTEITLPIERNLELDSVDTLFSPQKSECSFDLSCDYDAKLEEMVTKASRKEIMEIILGNAIESQDEMPKIDYLTEASIDECYSLKRKITEVETTVNNNTQVLSPNKIRILSNDHISSTTEESEERLSQRVVNNTRSKYLGKPGRVGLPRPRRSNLPNSPSSDKSVENYEQTTPQSVNGRIKTPRAKVQRYDTSDLYKPKLHYLSRRNNIT